MTDPFEEERLNNRTTTVETIAQEARQFKRLQHLSDYDVAHRMAKSLESVRDMRRTRNQLSRSLTEIGLPYEIRVILGTVNVKTSGQLFAFSDRELLALPRIGQARLAVIRQHLQEFFA